MAKIDYRQLKNLDKPTAQECFNDKSIPLSKIDSDISFMDFAQIVLNVTEKDTFVEVFVGKDHEPAVIVVSGDGQRIQCSERFTDGVLVVSWNEKFKGKIYIILQHKQ